MVRLPNGVWAGRYEVTQAQWESVMGPDAKGWVEKRIVEESEKPMDKWMEMLYPGGPEDFRSTSRKRCPSRPDNPVTFVSWDDCQDFLRAINALRLDGSSLRFRLPTEPEWKVAAAAGGKPDGFGLLPDGTEAAFDEVCWHAYNSDAIHRVGELKPNAYGLFDMTGNVGEWTSTPTPRKPGRWTCGGDAFNSHPPIDATVSDRGGEKSDARHPWCGFRLFADGAVTLQSGREPDSASMRSVSVSDLPAVSRNAGPAGRSSSGRSPVRKKFLAALVDANNAAVAADKTGGIRDPSESPSKYGAIMAVTGTLDGLPESGYRATPLRTVRLLPSPESGETVAAYYLTLAGDSRFGVPIEIAWEAMRNHVPCIAFDPRNRLTILFGETLDGRYGYSRPRDTGAGDVVWDPVDEGRFGYPFSFSDEERAATLEMAKGTPPHLIRPAPPAGAIAAPTTVPVENGVEWHDDSVLPEGSLAANRAVSRNAGVSSFVEQIVEIEKRHKPAWCEGRGLRDRLPQLRAALADYRMLGQCNVPAEFDQSFPALIEALSAFVGALSENVFDGDAFVDAVSAVMFQQLLIIRATRKAGVDHSPLVAIWPESATVQNDDDPSLYAPESDAIPIPSASSERTSSAASVVNRLVEIERLHTPKIEEFTRQDSSDKRPIVERFRDLARLMDARCREYEALGDSLDSSLGDLFRRAFLAVSAKGRELAELFADLADAASAAGGADVQRMVSIQTRMESVEKEIRTVEAEFLRAAERTGADTSALRIWWPDAAKQEKETYQP
jgi:hypothetical protein